MAQFPLSGLSEAERARAFERFKPNKSPRAPDLLTSKIAQSSRWPWGNTAAADSVGAHRQRTGPLIAPHADHLVTVRQRRRETRAARHRVMRSRRGRGAALSQALPPAIGMVARSLTDQRGPSTQITAARHNHRGTRLAVPLRLRAAMFNL